ncbi:voltage-gated chloride channel [bacterium]|jgi:H+/Cl- antiporter ClcA|nr:voltage-gated chloride channel [bacterium]
MHRKQFAALTEESVIFFSIIKWVVLATVIGTIVGTATSFFLKGLGWSIATASGWNNYYLLLPVAMFVSALLTKYLSPDSEGHGTEKVIESIHKRNGDLRARVVPVKIVTTTITAAFGGSIGKEGPAAQIGAALASVFAKIFHFSPGDRKRLVICGISAGFAAVFGTPIAGAIFGVEVLIVGSIMYEVLLPSFIAGMVSFQVASGLGVHYESHLLTIEPQFSAMLFLKVIISGMFFGLCAIFFIWVMKFGHHMSDRLKIWAPLKGLVGGVLLIALAMIFSTDYLGLGLDTMEHVLKGGTIIWYAFILKAIMTSITLGFGGSGGIVTPIFYIGVASGATYAHLVGENPILFAAIGFVSLLAGAANTPLAASIMAVELFGPTIGPYATLAAVLSFLFTGHRSAYASQVLGINKCDSIAADPGEDVDHSEMHYQYRTRKVMAKGLKIGKWVWKKRFRK